MTHFVVYPVAMDQTTSMLQREIKQRKPFPSRAAEATLGIWRTSALLRRYVARVVEGYGITMQQYNVLRILRGAFPEPLSRQDVADRMIDEQPGVTRLLDRLEARGLVRRERCTDDRRMVHCWITEQGLELLAEMDAPIEEADEALVRVLSDEEQSQLIKLLDRIRASAG